MPRSVSGNYTLPLPPVVPNTTIEAAWANTTDDDIAQALTDSLDRFGRGGMVAPFRLVDGAEAIPAWAFSAETGTGMYRESAGVMSVSIQGAKVGQWSAAGYTGLFSGIITGDFTFDGTVTFDGPAVFDNPVLFTANAPVEMQDEFPLTFSHPGATVIWNDGTIKGYIQHVALGDFMQFSGSGAGGIAFSNATQSMIFIGGVFSPGVASAVALGSTSKPWGDIFMAQVDSRVAGAAAPVASRPWTFTAASSRTIMAIEAKTNSGTDVQAGLEFYSWNGAAYAIGAGVNHYFANQAGTTANALELAVYRNAPLSFMTNSIERARFTGDGVLCIGTTTAFRNIGTSINILSSNTAVAIRHPSATAGRYWDMNMLSNSDLYINNAAGVGVFLAYGATAWAAASDERMKTDLLPIEDALAKVATLRAVTGRFKTDHVGIACAHTGAAGGRLRVRAWRQQRRGCACKHERRSRCEAPRYNR
jgi:hypothetical protein